MKRLVFAATLGCVVLMPVMTYANSNPLLDNDYWKDITLEKLERTLAQGHSVTDETKSNFTPLMYAVRNGANEALIDVLVTKGANVDRIGHDHRSAIFYAAYGGTLQTVNAVLKYEPNLAVLDDSGRNALLFSMYGQNDIAVFERLMDEGLDLHLTDTAGRNAALIVAQRGKDAAVIDFLKSNKVDFDVVDNDGRNMIHNAASRNENVDVLKSLISLGGNIKKKDRNGQNAILVAAYRNKNIEVFKLIADQGVSLRAKDKQGNSALTIAANRNTQEIVEFFIAQGLDPNHKNKQGISPLLNLASRSIDDEEQSNNALGIMRQLIAAGAKVRDIDNAGNTPLINAIRNQHGLATIDYLIDQGADINKVNKEELSALMVAAMLSTDDKIIKLLLDHGANADQADSFGDTAIELVGDNDHLMRTGAVNMILDAQKN